MIVRKFWAKRNIIGGMVYQYEGWFLLGIFPLYISRIGIK